MKQNNIKEEKLLEDFITYICRHSVYFNQEKRYLLVLLKEYLSQVKSNAVGEIEYPHLYEKIRVTSTFEVPKGIKELILKDFAEWYDEDVSPEKGYAESSLDRYLENVEDIK